MGWLMTLGILAALAALPLGIRVNYDSGGLLARLILGPVKLTVYPMPKKQKKPEKQSKKAEAPSAPKQEQENLPQPPQPPKPEKTGKSPRKKAAV